MVKSFIIALLYGFLLTFTLSASESNVVKADPLMAKVKSFMSERTYNNNRGFIKVIFEPKSAFYRNGRVNALKVVDTLKENGLLHLYFKTPQEFQLNFKTSGSPLFFVKLMGDTLRNIGYYRYVTVASTLDASEFTWSIKLKSEYITDPLALNSELKKSSSRIIDIERNSPKEWTYVIDITKAKLQVPTLIRGQKLILKRSLYAHWFNVSNIKTLKIQSPRGNHWYPYIAFYDSSLHLIKLIKKEKITYSLSLTIPKNARYIKISDNYTLKNVREPLTLIPSGYR